MRKQSSGLGQPVNAAGEPAGADRARMPDPGGGRFNTSCSGGAPLDACLLESGRCRVARYPDTVDRGDACLLQSLDRGLPRRVELLPPPGAAHEDGRAHVLVPLESIALSSPTEHIASPRRVVSAIRLQTPEAVCGVRRRRSSPNGQKRTACASPHPLVLELPAFEARILC